MPDWQRHLSPQVCAGELCARGSRVPVTVILDSPGEGSDTDEILTSYPTFAREHILAALSYAAELAHEERFLPLKAS